MKFYTTILAFAFAIYCNAQYYILPISSGNPNNINQEDKEYPPNGGLPNSWNSLLTGNKANPTWSSIDTIPFNFMFNGSSVSAYKVSSSGVLTFDVATLKSAPSHTNKALPDNSIPDKSVCVWGLSGKGSNDEIVTKTFGTAPNRQYWVMFNNYSEAINFGNHYTYFSIVLEETSNRIYIVDQRTFGTISPTLTLGVQINSSEAYQLSTSPNYNPLAGNNASRADNKNHGFVQGTQMTLDGFTKSLGINEDLLLSRGPFSIDVDVENVGADTISEIELNYQVNGNTPQIVSYSNLNLPTFSSVTLPLNGSWLPPLKGIYDLKVWIGSVNDTTDLNNINDTVSKTLKVYDADNERTPLIETFTSSTSQMSKSSNSHIETYLSNNSGQLTSLKYQMNSPGTGDPYFTNEGLTRKQYYAIQSVNTINIDGNMKMISQQLVQDSIDKRLNEVAFLKINSSFWTNGKKVYINADIDPLESFNGLNYVLQVAVFEKITTQNAKNSGETSFYHVMKKMIPDASGTFIGGLNKANASNYNFIYEFKGNYRLPTSASNPIDHTTEHSVEDFSDLGVVIWVQNNDNKEIIQSQYATYSIGITDNELNSGILVYPNPAQNTLTIVLSERNSNNLIKLVNSQGQEVYSQNASQSGEMIINTSELSRGVYFVKVIHEGAVSIKKILLI